jgi:hypothetical protein
MKGVGAFFTKGVIMIEIYSLNKTVPGATNIPLDNISLKKGQTVVLEGVSTLSFNACGVYEVTFDASAVASEAGIINVQFVKDSVSQPQAQTSATAADTTTIYPLSFTTLVQVPRNNTPCPCSEPTTAAFLNAGVGAVFNNVNICVTKLV